MTNSTRRQEGPTPSTITVFLTGAGGSGTIEVMRSLREAGGYRIIGADASPYAGGYALADRAYVVPMGADTAFEPAIRALLRSERPDFIVPLVDEEILTVHEVVREEGLATRVVAPRPAFCSTMLDKWATFQALREIGVPVPHTCLAGDVEDGVYPAVIKPRSGRGSRGLDYLRSGADLERYLEGAPLPSDAYIVQEHVRGTEFTVSTVVSLDGQTLAVVPKEVVSKKGITQVGVTRAVPAIDEVCRAVQDHLRADGPFNVQLMLDSEGTPYIFEINPRFSTTVALTLASGINEVEVVIQKALGRELDELSFRPDLMMVRYVTQIYLHESDWSALTAPSAPR